jgi:hypothetical protein
VSTGAPGRSPAEIRRDIDLKRRQLGTSVDALRHRVNELTDWRRRRRFLHRRTSNAQATAQPRLRKRLGDEVGADAPDAE